MSKYSRFATTLIPALFTASLLSLPAQASEESVKKAMEAKLGGRVDSVSKTSYMGGLYEVIAGGHVLYTDESVSAFIEGALFDTKTMKNMTGNSLKKYYAQQYAKLPFDQAIKVVRGKGQRTLVTFEDPNCGWCKRLVGEINKMDNVTVYTFLLPLLSAESEENSRNIWCSADRGKAWTNWMTNGVKPGAAKADCAWNRNDMLALGQKFSVNGTPAVLFPDGELNPGYMPAAELDKRLGKGGK